MMAQYRRIKGGLPKDVLLLFRLGDFYEMFFEDAQRSAAILNLALTKRQDVPMCGLPFHAAQGYIARLLKAGHKVAVCDQTEEAKPGKLVKREVTQILSPGTHFDDRMLTAERNNFLASVFASGGRFGLALVDLTTCSFRVTEFPDADGLEAELERVRPAELIFPDSDTALGSRLAERAGAVHGHEAWAFGPETASFTLQELFGVASLDGFGLRNRAAATGAAGGVVHYLTQHLRRDLAQVTGLVFYETSQFLHIDAASLRNLEVLEPLHRDVPGARSLYSALQKTSTPMGARLLRDWLSQPLAEVLAIRRRQGAVAAFLSHHERLEAFRILLREVRDIERTLGRLGAGSGSGRDLVSMGLGLSQIPRLRDLVFEADAEGLGRNTDGEGGDGVGGEAGAQRGWLGELAEQLEPEPALVELIGRAIVDEPPAGLREGGVIRDGFHAELDELRRAQRDGQQWIAQLQQQEIERTGIPSLKVRFNSVFGYYIEITKANLDRVPPEYHRKQTVANGERFITPALKEMESKILGAEERGLKLEAAIFQEVREAVLERSRTLQRTASALAQLDVLAGFAEIARMSNHTCPEITEDGVLWIADGRHPVLDQSATGEGFVPNDTDLDTAGGQIALITGPNMAGKSTYIRQVALLALMAHAGAYLPAREARIGLVDRLFTRIGASDNLARGQSTFMVEMSETANILNNATRRSLVILDEIGRGTSTFDGLSLAWSIVEHLHHALGARTLFATHYHELTELSARLPRLRNFNVAVREWNDQIVFLHKIVPGGTDKSYGIQVARLAGVPRPVVERAKHILRILEEAELDLQRVATAEAEAEAEAGTGTQNATSSGPASGTPAPTPPKRSPRHRAERDKLRQLPPSSQLDLFS
jgi:DNA mismatch repair protein MutS